MVFRPPTLLGISTASRFSASKTYRHLFLERDIECPVVGCPQVGVRWKTKVCTLIDYELKCTQRMVDKQEKCVKEWMIQQAYPCALSSTVESCKTTETPLKDQCSRSVVKSVPYTCIKEEMETFCDGHPAFVTGQPDRAVDAVEASEEATAKKKERVTPFKIFRKLRYLEPTPTRTRAATELVAASSAGDAHGPEQSEERLTSKGARTAPTRDTLTCLRKKEQHVPYRCSRSKAEPECKTIKRKETAPCIKDKPVVSTFDCSYTEVQLNCSGSQQNVPRNSPQEGQQGADTEGEDRKRTEVDNVKQTGRRSGHELPAQTSSPATREESEKVGSDKPPGVKNTASEGKTDKQSGTRDLRSANATMFLRSTRMTPLTSRALPSTAPPLKVCYHVPVTVGRTCKQILMRRAKETCEIESEEKICKTVRQDHPQICYVKKIMEEFVDCEAQQHLEVTAAAGLASYALLRVATEESTIRKADVAASAKEGETTGVTSRVVESSAERAASPRFLSAPPNCVTRVVARKDTCTKKLPFTEHYPCTSTVPVTTCSPSRNVDATTCYRAVQKSMEYSCVKPAKVEECVPVPVHRQGTCYEQEEYQEAFECEETQVQQVCKEEEEEVHSQCMKAVQRELPYPCLKKKQILNCAEANTTYSAASKNEQLLPEEELPHHLSSHVQWPTMPHKGYPASGVQMLLRHAASESTLHGTSAEQATEGVVSHPRHPGEVSLSSFRSAAFHALALAHSAAAAAGEAAANSQELEPAALAIERTASGDAHTAVEAKREMQASTATDTESKTVPEALLLQASAFQAPCTTDRTASRSSSSTSSICENSRRSSTNTASNSSTSGSRSGSSRRNSIPNNSKSVSMRSTTRSSLPSGIQGTTGAPARRLLPSFKPLGLKAKKLPPFSPRTTALPPSPAPVNRIFLGPRGHLLNGDLQAGHALPAADPHVHNTHHKPIVLPDPATVATHDLLNQHRKYTLTSPDQILPHIPPKVLPAGVFHHQHHPPLLVDGHLHPAVPAHHIHHVPAVVQPHEATALAPTIHQVSPPAKESETLVTDFKPVAPLIPGSRVPSLLEADVSPPWLSSHQYVTADTPEQQAERDAGGAAPPVTENEVSADSPGPMHTQLTHPVATTPTHSTEGHVSLVQPPLQFLHHAAAGVLPLAYPMNVGVQAGAAPAAVVQSGVVTSPEWTGTVPAGGLPPAAAVYPGVGPALPASHPYPYSFPYAHAPHGAFAHAGAGFPAGGPRHGLDPHYPVAGGPVLQHPAAVPPPSSPVAPNTFPYPHVHPFSTPVTGPSTIPDVTPMYPYQHHAQSSVLPPSAAVLHPSHPPHVPNTESGEPYHESAAVIQKSSELQEILRPARSALPEFHKLHELTAEIHYLMKLQRQQKGHLSESHRERLKQITVELEDLAGIHRIVPGTSEASETDEHLRRKTEDEEPSKGSSSRPCNGSTPPAGQTAKKRRETPKSRGRQPVEDEVTYNSAEETDSNLPTSLVDRRKSPASRDPGSTQTATGSTGDTETRQGAATYNGVQHAAAAGGKQRAAIRRKSGVDSEELEHVLNALLAELEADELALFEELRRPEMTAEDAEELIGELSLLREDIRIVADGRARLVTGELSYEEIQNLWAFLLGEASSNAPLQDGDETKETRAILQPADEEESELRATKQQGPEDEGNSSGSTPQPTKGVDLLGVSAESAALAAAAAALHKVMTATFAKIPLVAHHLLSDSAEETHTYDHTYAPVHLDTPVPVRAPSTTVVPVPSLPSVTYMSPFHSYQQPHNLHQAPHQHHTTLTAPEPLGAREAMLAAALEGAFEIKARIMDSIHALQQLLDTTDMPLDRENEAKQLLSALQRDLLRVQQLVGRLQHGKGLTTEDLQYISMQLDAVNGSSQASGQPPGSSGERGGEFEGTDGGAQRDVAAAAEATEGRPNSRASPNPEGALGRMNLGGEAGLVQRAEVEGGQPRLSSPPVNPFTTAASSGGGASSEGAPARTNVYITINIDENGDLDVLSPRRKDG